MDVTSACCWLSVCADMYDLWRVTCRVAKSFRSWQSLCWSANSWPHLAPAILLPCSQQPATWTNLTTWCYWGRKDSVVNAVTGLRIWRSGVRVPVQIYVSSKTLKLAAYLEGTGGGRGANRTAQYGAEVTNEWNCACAVPVGFYIV